MTARDGGAEGTVDEGLEMASVTNGMREGEGRRGWWQQETSG